MRVTTSVFALAQAPEQGLKLGVDDRAASGLQSGALAGGLGVGRADAALPAGGIRQRPSVDSQSLANRRMTGGEADGAAIDSLRWQSTPVGVGSRYG